MTKTLTMRDIEDLAKQAMREHCLLNRGWKFAWDRAQRRAGACKYRTKQITLSKPIFTIEANRDDVLDTILHEIAHALVGPGAGHGPRWKAMARQIGAKPERCHQLATPVGMAVGTCGCGSIHNMTRMPTAQYACKTCRVRVTWTQGYR